MRKTMQAVGISTPGGPEVLTLTERPLPIPGPEEVLVRVAAAGVNRPDCLQRAGHYPVPPGASDLPGLEIAGTVAAVGSAVTQWREGDAVCALTHGGGYAEYCSVDAGHCLPIPKGMSMRHAAAFPETGFTVYLNVWMRAALQPGESLLVHGGSSGIGSIAIQMAKAVGHDVIITAGSDEKCDFCRRLGADLAINYRQGDWFETLKAARPDGVDVILDMVAGDYVQKNLDSLKIDGRLSMIALLRGPIAKSLDVSGILRKRLSFMGSTLRPQSVAAKRTIADGLARDILPLLEAGSVTPMIYETFPLAEAAAAHRLMESGDMMGKLVLDVA